MKEQEKPLEKYIIVQFPYMDNLDEAVKDKVEQRYKLIGVTMATGRHYFGHVHDMSWVATMELEIIYLQSEENSITEGRTWCEDMHKYDDTVYIRKDIATAREKELKKALELLKQGVIDILLPIYNDSPSKNIADSLKLDTIIDKVEAALLRVS